MREYKFKGRRLGDGCWCFGYLVPKVIRREITWWIVSNLTGSGYDGLEVDPATIGQFTGLTDKAGREIYEGDIVAHPYIDPIFGDLVEMKDGKGVKSVVVFHEGAFCIRYGEDVFYYLDQFTRHKHIEVVGNIHDDNPELLEEGGKK